MIAVHNLTVRFRVPGGIVTAVRDVSFTVAPGETFGIVGESGSGKSTVLRAIAGLVPAPPGSVALGGTSVGLRRSKAQRQALQFVFQDPYGALHPRQTVDRILREPLAIHGDAAPDARIAAALQAVDLSPQHRFRYPHQLSGGQRQRVAIARALILEPEILLLDVSVQAEVLNLLSAIRAKRRLTSILVSHDLAVVAHLCDRVAIMRQTALIEVLDVAELRAGAGRQAYTRALIEASRGYRRSVDQVSA